jgi:cytochrome c biogenesis protein CcdA
MLEQTLETLATQIDSHRMLAPLIGFVAGVLTSFTPCSLANLPLVIGYVGGIGESSSRKAFLYSVLFALGSAVTYVALGVVAASAGQLLGNASEWWYLFLGALLTMMALQMCEIFIFIPSTNLMAKSKLRGGLGALAAGVLGGLFASPCATPVLAVLLSLLASDGNILWAILVMLTYSIGNSILIVVAGTSIGKVTGILKSKKYQLWGEILKYVMGIAIFAFALYMFWLGF